MTDLAARVVALSEDRQAARVLRDAIEAENCAYPGADGERDPDDTDENLRREVLDGLYDLVAVVRTLRAMGWSIPQESDGPID